MESFRIAETKEKNVIDMAVSFTAMMRLFEKGSADKIKDKLNDTIKNLGNINANSDFDHLHDLFCQWFVKNIKTAKKSERASYGHAAKVFDIALKVYVYYCNLPTLEKAQQLLPMLNGAVDRPILKHIIENQNYKCFPKSSLASLTIAMIDKDTYHLLQKLIIDDISRSFNNKILPVQYDDIMWRHLNR